MTTAGGGESHPARSCLIRVTVLCGAGGLLQIGIFGPTLVMVTITAEGQLINNRCGIGANTVVAKAVLWHKLSCG